MSTFLRIVLKSFNQGCLEFFSTGSSLNYYLVTLSENGPIFPFSIRIELSMSF